MTTVNRIVAIGYPLPRMRYLADFGISSVHKTELLTLRPDSPIHTAQHEQGILVISDDARDFILYLEDGTIWEILLCII